MATLLLEKKSTKYKLFAPRKLQVERYWRNQQGPDQQVHLPVCISSRCAERLVTRIRTAWQGLQSNWLPGPKHCPHREDNEGNGHASTKPSLNPQVPAEERGEVYLSALIKNEARGTIQKYPFQNKDGKSRKGSSLGACQVR